MDAMVTARMPQGKKEAAVAVLKELGLTASQAINEFFDLIIATRRLPLERPDVIVTRDEGLANGIIPTRTPEEFFLWLKEKHRIGCAEMQFIDGTWQRTL